MINSEMDSKIHYTSCDLCLEEFQESERIQNCAHVFCDTCLFQKSPVNGTLCPICDPSREMEGSLDGLPTRVVKPPGRNLGQATSDPLKLHTETPSNEESLFKRFLCNQNKQHVCLSASNLLKILKTGQRILPDCKKSETPEPGMALGKGMGFCAEHDSEEMKYYCETCRRSICRDCAFLEHKTHAYVYYKNRKAAYKPPAQDVKEKFQKIFSAAEEKKKTLQTKLDLLESNLDRKLREIEGEREKVLSRSRQLKSLIVEQEKSLIVCLEREKNMMIQCVDTKKAVLRAALGEVSQGLELAKGAFKRDEISKQLKSTMSEPTMGKTKYEGDPEADVGVSMETDDLSSHLKAKTDTCEYSLGKRLQYLSDEEAEKEDQANIGTFSTDSEADDFTSPSDQSRKSGSGLPVDDIDPYPSPVTPNFAYHSTLGGKGTDNAAFQDPVGIATSSDGILAIADYTNDRVQLFTSDGTLIRVLTHVETEKGRKIALLSPTGVAFDRAGNLVIAERGRHRVTVMEPNGKLIRKFGKLGKALDQFRAPHGVSVDKIGRIIVADTANNRIQVFDKNGEFIFKFGDKGDHKLDYPNYAIFHKGVFYVSDTDNDSVKVFDKEGTFLRYLWTNELQDPLCPVKDQNVPDSYSEDLDVPFSAPSGLAVYKDSFVLVCDYNRNCIKVFSLQGHFLTEFGKEGTGPGQFCGPEAIAVLPDGLIVVSDKGNHRLQMFK